MAEVKTPRIDGETFEKIFYSVAPHPEDYPITVEEIGYGYARIRLGFRPNQLRMGNTISGPALFALADSTLFAAVLSIFGPEREALTTDMTIRFLARPAAVDTVAEARVLRSGRNSATGEVTIRSEGGTEPVVKCLGGYAVVGPRPEA